MNRNWIERSVIGIMAFTALTVSGCAVVGLFWKDGTYAAQESWEIKAPSPDLLDAIAETGRSMGLEIDYGEVRNPPPGLEYGEMKSPPPVNENDTRSAAIMLSDNGGGLKAVLIGKYNVLDVTFYARQGKYMEVYVMVAGNFGAGKEKVATKMLSDFRTNLSKRIGEIIVTQGAHPAGTPAAHFSRGIEHFAEIISVSGQRRNHILRCDPRPEKDVRGCPGSRLSPA
jgi:hypothetical protein